MYSLFIDTHSSLITVALINEHEILKCEQESINSHSIYLLPMIDELISKNNLKMSDLKEILVVNGPGSFTGIRIGLSVAKTLAYCLNIPIKTISSLTAYLISNEGENKLAIIEDNKGCYFSVFDKDNKQIIDESYTTKIEELKKEYNLISNKLNLRKVYDFLLNKKGENVHLIKANYIKQIEALK